MLLTATSDTVVKRHPLTLSPRQKLRSGSTAGSREPPSQASSMRIFARSSAIASKAASSCGAGGSVGMVAAASFSSRDILRRAGTTRWGDATREGERAALVRSPLWQVPWRRPCSDERVQHVDAPAESAELSPQLAPTVAAEPPPVVLAARRAADGPLCVAGGEEVLLKPERAVEGGVDVVDRRCGSRRHRVQAGAPLTDTVPHLAPRSGRI